MAEKKSIQAKLLKALQAMKNPTKNTQAYNYKYATLDQVLDIVKPALFEQGLYMRQAVQPTGSLDASIYDIATFVGDEEQELLLDCRPYSVKQDAQKQGSFDTYMRRYALMMCFGLAGEDDDGSAASEKIEKPTLQQDFSGFTELKTRLMKATGATEKDAATALINTIGNPSDMTTEAYKKALIAGDAYVSRLEKSSEQS